MAKTNDWEVLAPFTWNGQQFNRGDVWQQPPDVVFDEGQSQLVGRPVFVRPPEQQGWTVDVESGTKKPAMTTKSSVLPLRRSEK